MTELDRVPPREHLLLTVLGREPQPVQYALESRQVKGRLAPVALLDLLPKEDRPGRVLALCTPEARQDSWPLLKEALRDKCQVKRVEIPSGDKQEDVDAFLKAVTAAIGADVDLTVDVTHGLRHFSFLTYVSVLYLAALRNVDVRGAYYGMLNRDGPNPFLDLRPLLELPRWIHALEVLRETGSALPLASQLDRSDNQTAQRVVRDLSSFSKAYLSGLPIELGRHARELRCQRLPLLKRMLRRDHRLPLAGELVDGLDRMLEEFTLAGGVSGDGWKGQIVLSRDELERQARVIDDLLKHQNTAAALGLMNEWTVSWVAWRQGQEGEWLDYHRGRRRAAGLLDAIEALARDPDLRPHLTCEQRRLGTFWSDLRGLRNAFHHHGMRRQVLIGNKEFDKKLEDIKEHWRDALRSCPKISLSLGQTPGKRVLVSPIGLRPGVLFSAVQACRASGDGRDPELCLVVCSRETVELIAEALEHARFEGDFEALALEDAFGGGPQEIDGLVNRARSRFIGADQVLVNVTGGTTLMGLAAESLASEARSLACPSVRRFGLIDRRPPGKQESDPYRAGEPFWLDGQEDDDANRN